MSFLPQPLINNGEMTLLGSKIFSAEWKAIKQAQIDRTLEHVTRTRVVCFQGLWGQEEAPSRERMIHLRVRKSFWRPGCVLMKHHVAEKEVKYR